MSSIVTGRDETRTSLTRATLVTALTVVINLLAAAVLSAAVSASDEFQALQSGPVAFATAVAMAAGVGLLAAMRKRWSRAADRRFTIIAVVVGVASCVAPLSMLGADAETVDGWSAAAVWSLLPLHLIPTVAAAALPAVTRR
jgi:hypothetical protein